MMTRKLHNDTSSAGFTLIEVLLSVAIITLLTGISVPIYASFQTRNDLDLTTQGIADMLRRAQAYARGVSGDSQWGVEVQSGTVTLFKGATFSGHDTSYDETTTIPASMNATGFTEVLYSKLGALPTFTPAASTTLTLTTNANETRTITVNAKGMVSY
jgi:prepilin-type N-terminal cleavage/methylation domain-containing protein